MLTNKAIHEETTAAEKVIEGAKDPVQASILKMLVLILKMMSSIRTNQVLIMEKQGVPKLKPQDKKDEDK